MSRNWKTNTQEYQALLNKLSNDNAAWIIIYQAKKGIDGFRGHPGDKDGTEISDYMPTKRIIANFNDVPIPIDDIYTVSELNTFDFTPKVYKELTQEGIVYIIMLKDEYFENEGEKEYYVDNIIEHFGENYNTNLIFEEYGSHEHSIILARVDYHFEETWN